MELSPGNSGVREPWRARTVRTEVGGPYLTMQTREKLEGYLQNAVWGPAQLEIRSRKHKSWGSKWVQKEGHSGGLHRTPCPYFTGLCARVWHSLWGAENNQISMNE